MIPTVQVSDGWETVLEGQAWHEVQRSALPQFLRGQRWFGGKGRRIRGMQRVDRADITDAAGQSFLLLLEVEFTEGKSDLYFLPLRIAAGNAGKRMLQDHSAKTIALLRGTHGEAVLHEALAEETTCTGLLDAIGSGRVISSRKGQIRAFPTTAFASLRGDPQESLPVTLGLPTSSNSLIFFGQRLMLKLFRRLEPGINPDFEIGRFLTEANVFTRIPRVAGAIEYHRVGAEPITLAILQANIVNQGDGWHHALKEMEQYYSCVANRPTEGEFFVVPKRSPLELADGEPPRSVRMLSVRMLIGDYLDSACTLGRRTAELHQALAADAGNPGFAPEPFTRQDAAAVRASIRQQGQIALNSLRANLDRLPENVAESACQLLADGPRALEQGGRVLPNSIETAKIRCHGDYHLGQVLRVENDYVLLDFEGEPVRTVQERRAKQSPLKDVAGMIRSYHYAAFAGLFAFTEKTAGEFGELEPWADGWFRWVSAAFLRGYRTTANDAVFVPRSMEQFAALLDAFLLDKAFYELNYELNNRPDWVRIPLRGILASLEAK
jgi:maltose alpha-D-glucosyltransferase/alpha-amylase